MPLADTFKSSTGEKGKCCCQSLIVLSIVSVFKWSFQILIHDFLWTTSPSWLYASQEKVDKIPPCQNSDDIKSKNLFLIPLDMKLKSYKNST